MPDDCQLTVNDISEVGGISCEHEMIHVNILYEYLGYKKAALHNGYDFCWSLIKNVIDWTQKHYLSDLNVKKWLFVMFSYKKK